MGGVRASLALPPLCVLLLLLLLLSLSPSCCIEAARNHGKRPRLAPSARVGVVVEEQEQPANISDIYTGATALPVKALPRSSLPSHFDWCDVKGVSYCTASWNQHIPRYCGACYVHGALAAANDRIKILLQGKHDMTLARQVILNCGPSHGLGAGCDGGEGFDVFEYMHRYGLPDESCQNYVAKESAQCDQQAVCQNCMPVAEGIWPYKCWAVPSPILYYVHSYGSVHGELSMMSEILQRGPITCGFASVDDFDYNYRGGIYYDRTNATEMNHDVEVVGWGVDKAGMKYWIARNSWGTYWGENSFFKIARGINNMQFESDCIFAIFDVHHVRDVLQGKLGGSMFGLVKQKDVAYNTSRENPHVNTTKEEKHPHSKTGKERGKEKGKGREALIDKKEMQMTLDEQRVLREHRRAVDAATLVEEYRSQYGQQPHVTHSQSYAETDSAAENDPSADTLFDQPNSHPQNWLASGTIEQSTKRPSTRDSDYTHDTTPKGDEEQEDKPETLPPHKKSVPLPKKGIVPDGNATDNNSWEQWNKKYAPADGTAYGTADAPHHPAQGAAREQQAPTGNNMLKGNDRYGAAKWARTAGVAVDPPVLIEEETQNQQDQAAIADAVSLAYHHEQTRDDTPRDPDNNAALPDALKAERARDEAAIALSIRTALIHSGNNAELVGKAVLRAIDRIRSEAKHDIKLAVKDGADEKEDKRRELDRTEDAVYRMWIQETSNASFSGWQQQLQINDIAEKIQHYQHNEDNDQPAPSIAVSESLSSNAIPPLPVSPSSSLFSLFLGVCLGALFCVTIWYLCNKYKQRHFCHYDYDYEVL